MAGLLKNDLDHLILPLIEIDTFESKIDNARAVVVAFYVFEQEPARDLERFIEKGEVKVMDAETSPAPTEDGYYVVFIELSRDRNLPEMILRIIEDVNNLTNIKQWQFRTVNDSEIHDLTEDNLKEFINLDPASVPPTEDDLQDDLNDRREEEPETEDEPEAEEELAEFIIPIFKHGLMESIEIDRNELHLLSPGVDLAYEILYVSNEVPSVPILTPNIGHPAISESVKLSRVLGPAYSVEIVEEGLLVSNENGCILLNPLD